MGLGGVRIAVLAAVVGLIAVAVAHAQPVRMQDQWVTTRTSAEARLKGRFTNIERVACRPDRQHAETQVFGTVRYWSRFLCDGTTRDGVTFSLTFHVIGKCDDCWTITNLNGIGITDLKRKSGQTSTPASPAQAGRWYDDLELDDRIEARGIVLPFFGSSSHYDIDSAFCDGLRRYGVRPQPYSLDKFRVFNCVTCGTLTAHCGS